MKKFIFYVAVVLFGLDTAVSANVLMHPDSALVLSTTIGIWGIYALFVIGAFIDMRQDDTPRWSKRDSRRFWKERRKFWKEYEKMIKEGKWE